MSAPPHVDVHLSPADLSGALRADVRAGLGSRPLELPPKWLYDERGCALFEQITRLPEYYLTAREREILAREAGEVARLTGADSLVELGSGTSEKTRLLVDALAAAGQLRRIVAFDVSEPAVGAATAALATEYPGAEVRGVVGDFDRHLHLLPTAGRRLIVFLGSTIGNLGPLERKWFLAELAGGMSPGDAFLLGTDLVKDPARLQAAYDDPGGVTASFNRNILSVVNRELDADFAVERFEHRARFDADNEWMEMQLRAPSPQFVTIAGLEMTVELDAGEGVRTEISAKFRRAGVEAELAEAGLELARWWTDGAGDYAVSLSVPA